MFLYDIFWGISSESSINFSSDSYFICQVLQGKLNSNTSIIILCFISLKNVIYIDSLVPEHLQNVNVFCLFSLTSYNLCTQLKFNKVFKNLYSLVYNLTYNLWIYAYYISYRRILILWNMWTVIWDYLALL